MLTEMLAGLSQHLPLVHPPDKDIVLYQSKECMVYVGDSWGPAIPYGPADHGDGTENHGYRRVKGALADIPSIPELVGWPEYQDFIRVVNSDDSPIESLGCEKAFFPFNQGNARSKLGSYVDVAFTDLSLNEDPSNFLRLIDATAHSLDGCDQWWSCAEFGLERLRRIGHSTTAWGLLIRVLGYGRNQGEARRMWAESIGRLGNGISKLPPDFPISPSSTMT